MHRRPPRHRVKYQKCAIVKNSRVLPLVRSLPPPDRAGDPPRCRDFEQKPPPEGAKETAGHEGVACLWRGVNGKTLV